MPMQYYRNFGLNWLDGSIRVDLDSAGRGIWADLLALASVSRRAGYLERSKGIPYTIQEMAQRFRVDEDMLMRTIAVCENEGRLSHTDDGTFYITNWDNYQDIKLGEELNSHKFKKVKKPLSEAQKKAILRRWNNQHPDIAADVITHDFGYTIINRATGEELETRNYTRFDNEVIEPTKVQRQMYENAKGSRPLILEQGEKENER